MWDLVVTPSRFPLASYQRYRERTSSFKFWSRASASCNFKFHSRSVSEGLVSLLAAFSTALFGNTNRHEKKPWLGRARNRSNIAKSRPVSGTGRKLYLYVEIPTPETRRDCCFFVIPLPTAETKARRIHAVRPQHVGTRSLCMELPGETMPRTSDGKKGGGQVPEAQVNH